SRSISSISGLAISRSLNARISSIVIFLRGCCAFGFDDSSAIQPPELATAYPAGSGDAPRRRLQLANARDRRWEHIQQPVDVRHRVVAAERQPQAAPQVR